MQTQHEDFMRASDAYSWYQKADPTLRATIVAVVWLDQVPDWERLAHRVEAATRLVPRLRQRVETPPVRISAPRWVTDSRFDLSWHLRRENLPSPGAAAMEVLAPAPPFTAADQLSAAERAPS